MEGLQWGGAGVERGSTLQEAASSRLAADATDAPELLPLKRFAVPPSLAAVLHLVSTTIKYPLVRPRSRLGLAS